MDYKEIKKLVLQKVDIKTVVDHYLGSGKQVGKQFFYRSPFKEGFDRTPSFAVLPSKQIFKCFSTNKGGNVIKFV
ncbi:MAG: CHC2 zinc finger domain-containing protein, partial [Candidatus Dojkabacteria bacterium]|nr:CHC2 zinc finger domain-containing protein [Candidatus Dojkabacteria bacterium]